MVYATGGFAQVDLKINGNFFCNVANCGTENNASGTVSATRSGWVAGAGVEFKQPGSPWIIGVEYLYYGFAGNSTANAAFLSGSGAGSRAAGQPCVSYPVGNFDVQSVRLRLSYKFN